VWHFRADLAGIPTGFAQCYDTAKAPQGPEYTTPRTLGVDYFWGRTSVLGQGYGTQLLTEFVAYIKAQWQPWRIIADPPTTACGRYVQPHVWLYLGRGDWALCEEVHEAAPQMLSSQSESACRGEGPRQSGERGRRRVHPYAGLESGVRDLAAPHLGV
jgi:hypothetical protein